MIEDSHLIYDLHLLYENDYYKEDDFRFVTETLKIMEKNNLRTEITDLAILTGGTNKIMLYDKEDGNVKTVDNNQNIKTTSVYDRSCVICPRLHWDILYNKLINNSQIEKHGIRYVEYGEYPQTAASFELQKVLEESYQKGELPTIKDSYTFSSTKSNSKESNLDLITYNAYQYQDKKYIRVKANRFDDKNFKLSNGIEYSNGDYVWVEVQPVKWIMDDYSETMFSLKGLVSGVNCADVKEYYNTEVKYYMDHYMTKDLFQSNSLTIEDYFSKDKIINRMNTIEWEKKYAIREALQSLFNHLAGSGDGSEFDDGRFYFIYEMIDKYNLSRDIQAFLTLNFDKVFHQHGKYQVVKKYQGGPAYLYEDDLDEDELCLKVLDEKYINTLKETFGNSPLSISDYMNLKNMGNYDLDALSKIYSGISLDKIKDIILRGRLKNNVYSLFEKLNNKSEEYQEKVLELIKPIISDLIDFKDYECHGYNYLKCYITGKRDINERIYERISTLEKKKVNIYFLKEFESLFLDFFISNSENISMDVLDKLLNLRNYVISKIPKHRNLIYEEKVVEEIGKVQGFISYDPSSGYSTVKRIVPKQALTFSKQKVLKIKKLVLLLLPMIINNEISYEELLNVDLDSKYILGLIDTVKSTEKDTNKVKQKTLK